ncbi:N-formylglutamate deformylase [Minicystis rosea]|nr:N-formylglutamate deformylase [Minicystis rosea]
MLRLVRARRSLDGLALGDAMGRALVEIGSGRPAFREAPWRYTDDTEMAIAIVTTLAAHGRIDQDALALEFARRFSAAPERGYGAIAYWMLTRISEGQPWREVARTPYDGQGSQGNGAAMRVAPLGAYFADDLDRVVLEAEASAVVTHAHPEGRAGAIAVAVAAAITATAAQGAKSAPHLWDEVLRRTPPGDTHAGLELAASFLGIPPRDASRRLGTGRRILASDTVPLAIWCAASHLDDYQAAILAAIEAFDSPDSDADTTCAIVGGIVALSAAPETVPPRWKQHREPLPKDGAG